jgi:hypothetical protein
MPLAHAEKLPHHAKPLLLDLLDTYRGQWSHPAPLGQVMDLDGPVHGLFALPAPLDEGASLRLGAVLTPSDDPAAWDRAELCWAEPDTEGHYHFADPHWSTCVTLTRVHPSLIRADLTELHCDQAFLSPMCLAGIVLETPQSGLVPFVLMPIGETPSFRLETDAVGNLAVGEDHITVRVRGYSPLDTAFGGALRLELREKLTGESAGALPISLPIAAGTLTEREIDVELPRFGIFDARLVDAGLDNREGDGCLANLRLIRVPAPRLDITPDASSFGINVFQHQLWWYAFQPPLLQAMGAKWVRPWLAWENTWRMQEPDPGRYDFTHLDNAVNRLARYGMAYENILFSSPERVGGSGLLHTPPPAEHLPLWEAWVAAVAAHFRGRIQHYEVWNEPDWMWPGKGGEHAAEYLPLLETARHAAKTTDPDCLIDAPSSAGNRRWLTDTVALGARDLTDVFTFHFYSSTAAFNHHLRMRLDLWGGADGWQKPVWLNEIGNAACDLNPSFNEQVDSNELNQAQVLVGEAALFLAEQPDGKLFWFCSLDPHDPYHKPEWTPDKKYPGDAAIGLLYEGLLPKLGFAAFAAMARELDGRKALGQWSPAPGLRVAAFEGERAVVFHDDLEQSAPFSAVALGCAPDEIIIVLDVCGNERQRAKAADLSLDCSRGPVYLRGSAALEQIGALHGTLARLRPPGILSAGDHAQRVAVLPQDAVVECEVLQEGQVLNAEMTRNKGQATLSLDAAEGVDHALACVRLRLRTSNRSFEELFPVTIGTLSLLDAPDYTFNPKSLCTYERAGGIDWSPAQGHLAPGCLVLSAPYDGRLANWQQWYPGLQPEKPLQWSVWLKAENLRDASCNIALAQFGQGKWLGDHYLVTPNQCPAGDSEWLHIEGRVEAAEYPAGIESMALYVDIAKSGDTAPQGRLLIDELDVWQPAQ